MLRRHLRVMAPIVLASLLSIVPGLQSESPWTVESEYEFNDAHFHLTNYIQEGTPIREFLKIMGTTTGRSVLFGIPLQQQWSYRISSDNALFSRTACGPAANSHRGYGTSAWSATT
jgi:hypothetical protein